ncbi:hypothetical protein J3Q64DRAFT_1375789 [Phycomyces blakesleeanus]|uniref:Uncharacterized protein n=1 Tax=Phycomyces blakesleeanus TaxID=4837 RepID=A0ABR3AJQ0_PHYBL
MSSNESQLYNDDGHNTQNLKPKRSSGMFSQRRQEVNFSSSTCFDSENKPTMLRSATSMHNIHTYSERSSQRQAPEPLETKASGRQRPLSYSTGTSAGLSPTLVRNGSTNSNKNLRSIHRTVTPRVNHQDPNKTQESLLRSSEDTRRVNRHSLTPRASNKGQVNNNIEAFFALDSSPRQISRPPGVACERPGKASNGTKEGVSRSSMSDLEDRRRNASLECQPLGGVVAQEIHSRSDKASITPVPTSSQSSGLLSRSSKQSDQVHPKSRNLRSAASFASLRPPQQTPAPTSASAARLPSSRSPPPPTPPPSQRLGTRQTLHPKTPQEKPQNIRLLAQASRRDSTDTTSTASSFSSSSSDASQRSSNSNSQAKQSTTMYPYRGSEDERSTFTSDTDVYSFDMYPDGGDYSKPEALDRSTPSDDENQLEKAYENNIDYLKDKLHKEQATVKALQRQKQACNNDISFLSQSVDALSMEKQEWIKRFEAEKVGLNLNIYIYKVVYINCIQFSHQNILFF